MKRWKYDAGKPPQQRCIVVYHLHSICYGIANKLRRAKWMEYRHTNQFNLCTQHTAKYGATYLTFDYICSVWESEEMKLCLCRGFKNERTGLFVSEIQSREWNKLKKCLLPSDSSTSFLLFSCYSGFDLIFLSIGLLPKRWWQQIR